MFSINMNNFHRLFFNVVKTIKQTQERQWISNRKRKALLTESSTYKIPNLSENVFFTGILKKKQVIEKTTKSYEQLFKIDDQALI